MQLRDFCTVQVATCGRDTSVAQAARIMQRLHVGDLVVVDDPGEERAPVGIVTDRDIVVSVVAQDVDPATVAAGELMRRPVAVAQDTDDVFEAVARMHSHGVRRLPVVNAAQQLVGIVSLDDILGVLGEQMCRLVRVAPVQRDHEQRSTEFRK